VGDVVDASLGVGALVGELACGGADAGVGAPVGDDATSFTIDSVCTSPQPAFEVVVCTTSVRYATGITSCIEKPGIVRFTVADPLKSEV
jgi:hypothetical protein